MRITFYFFRRICMTKFNIEEQQPFYEAFFGQRMSPSHIKRIERDFASMIKTFKADLLYYHKDATSAQLREAIIVGLKVMHRLGANHPNAYEKNGFTNECSGFGARAFKHADRHLQGKPLQLPPLRDEEELWDEEQTRRSKQREKRQNQIEEYSRDEELSETERANRTMSMEEALKNSQFSDVLEKDIGSP